jgi:hypothetical protein
VPLTAGIAAAVWGLIYVLAWAAVPASLATEWSGRGVPRADVVALEVERERRRESEERAGRLEGITQAGFFERRRLLRQFRST